MTRPSPNACSSRPNICRHERQGDAQFAPGTTVEVRLPLADPGTVAAGFRFTLR